MRCRDVERLCTSYVDGGLDEGIANALRGHLRVCADCRTRVEDEVLIRDSAADLEPLDPPPSLWAGVEARLAEAEIADAGRSRFWFWWRGLRQHALPAAVAAAAVIALVVWNSRRGAEPAEDRPVAERAADRTGDPEASPRLDAPDEPARAFLEQRRLEVLQADDRYAKTIAELVAIATEERAAWSADAAGAFDARLAHFEEQARDERGKLALNQSHDPRTRDALYAVYRAQIGYLQRAVLGGMAR